MTEKKQVELTKTEDRILKAIKTLMNEADPKNRIPKLPSEVLAFMDKNNHKVSKGMVQLLISYLVQERILVVINAEKAKGRSILYEFNVEAYEARKFVVVIRRKVSIYPQPGKKKPAEEGAQPDEKKDKRPDFDVWAVYDGAKKLLDEKYERRESLLAELAQVTEEISSLQEMTGSFEASVERMKKVVG